MSAASRNFGLEEKRVLFFKLTLLYLHAQERELKFDFLEDRGWEVGISLRALARTKTLISASCKRYLAEGRKLTFRMIAYTLC